MAVQHILILGGRSFPLAESEDLGNLETQILQASMRGGGFVNVALADGGQLACLVTPGTPLAVEHIADLADLSESRDIVPEKRRALRVLP